MTSAPAPTTRWIFGRALLLNALVVVESAAGLLLLVVVLKGEGFSATSDALFAAWTIPQMLGRGLFVTFTASAMGYLLDAEPEEYRRRGGEIMQLAAVLGGGLSLLLAATAGLWVPGALSGADAATRAQALGFTRWTVWLCLWAALSDAQRSLLYGGERLVWPSLARLLGTAAQVAGAFLAVGTGRPQEVALAVGLGPLVEVLIGGLVLLADARLRPRFAWLGAATVREVFRVNALPLLGRVAEVPARLLEQSLTSYLPPGTLAAVQVSRRVGSSISNFVYRGLTTTTLLPGALADEARVRDLFRAGVCIGAAVLAGLLVHGRALGAVLFEYGKVTGEDIATVARFLRFLSVGLFLGGLNRIHYTFLLARKAGGFLFWVHFTGSAVFCLVAPLLFRSLPGLDALGSAEVLGALGGALLVWNGAGRRDATGMVGRLRFPPVLAVALGVAGLATLGQPLVVAAVAPLGPLAGAGELAVGGGVVLGLAALAYRLWGRQDHPAG